MKKTISFAILNETKGAVRFQEVNDLGLPLDMNSATIGTLYVRKSALGGAIPKTLTITLEG